MPMLTVLEKGLSLQLRCQPHQSVLEKLNQAEIKINTACTGSGVCGLCKIKLLSGQATPLTPIERQKLSRQQLAKQIRLACQVQMQSDLTIQIENPRPRLRWKVLTRLTKSLLNPTDEYGFALDLGTTHLRFSLWNLTQQQRVIAWICPNPQAQFGADILSRLTVAETSAESVIKMSHAIQHTIWRLMRMLAKFSFSLHQVHKFCIVGNTPMLALFAQKNYLRLLDPTNWTQQIDCELENLPRWQKLLGVSAQTELSIVPPLAGFIGSDLLAGLLSTALTQTTACKLFIDFGTNSEIALWDGHKLWISSVPGGPAFEGCGISSGIPAGDGAICNVSLHENTLTYQQLGYKPPTGLCGSGLVDVIAILLATGQLKSNGRFADAKAHEIRLNFENGLSLSLKKQDIDIFQRAKAATATAIIQLFKQARLHIDMLEKIYVCGAFGHFLTLSCAQTIGLLPAVAPEKIVLSENTALQGAELLLDTASLKSQNLIRKHIQIVNMAYALDFDNCFVENLYLRPMRI